MGYIKQLDIERQEAAQTLPKRFVAPDNLRRVTFIDTDRRGDRFVLVVEPVEDSGFEEFEAMHGAHACHLPYFASVTPARQMHLDLSPIQYPATP